VWITKKEEPYRSGIIPHSPWNVALIRLKIYL